MKKIILFISVFLFANWGLFAQETTSEIQGTIVSGSQKLAGAIITATHTPTNTVYKTTSREDGRYNLPNLKIGGPILLAHLMLDSKMQHKIILR